MRPGSILVIYTDGITEAFDDKERQFGHRKLMDVLEEHHDEGASALKDAFLGSLDQHRGRVELADDVTLLIIRLLPNEPMASPPDQQAAAPG